MRESKVRQGMLEGQMAKMLGVLMQVTHRPKIPKIPNPELCSVAQKLYVSDACSLAPCATELGLGLATEPSFRI